MTFTHDTAPLKLLRGETPTLGSYVAALRHPQPHAGGPVWWQAAAPQTPESRPELVRALMTEDCASFPDVFMPIYENLMGTQESTSPANSSDLISVALAYHAAQLILDLRVLLEDLPDTEDEIVIAALPGVQLAWAAYEQIQMSHAELRAMRRSLLGLSPGETGWILTEAFGPAKRSDSYLMDAGSVLTPTPLRRLLRAAGRHSALQEATSGHLLKLAGLSREAPTSEAQRRVARTIASRAEGTQVWNPGASEAELIRQLRALQPEPQPGASPLTALAALRLPWPGEHRAGTSTNNTLALWMLAELRRRCPQLTSWKDIGGTYVLTPGHPLASELPELVRA